eukprot:CFRG5114T1
MFSFSSKLENEDTSDDEFFTAGESTERSPVSSTNSSPVPQVSGQETELSTQVSITPATTSSPPINSNSYTSTPTERIEDILLAASLKRLLAVNQQSASSSPNSFSRLDLPESASSIARNENNFADAEITLQLPSGITGLTNFRSEVETVCKTVLDGRVKAIYDESSDKEDVSTGLRFARVRSASNLDKIYVSSSALVDRESSVSGTEESVWREESSKSSTKHKKNRSINTDDIAVPERVSGDATPKRSPSGTRLMLEAPTHISRIRSTSMSCTSSPGSIRQARTGSEFPSKKRGSLVVDDRHNKQTRHGAQEAPRAISLHGSFQDINTARIEILNYAVTQTMNKRKSFFYPPRSNKNAVGKLQIFVDHSNVFFGAQKSRSANPLDEGAYLADRRLRLCVKQLVRLVERGRNVETRKVVGANPNVEDPIWDEWRGQNYDTRIGLRTMENTEQFVDDALHSEILRNLLMHTEPQTLVIMSGDGNPNNGGTTFPWCCEEALKRKWKVEVYAYAMSCSREYARLRKRYPQQMWITYLDDYQQIISYILVQPRLRTITSVGNLTSPIWARVSPSVEVPMNVMRAKRREVSKKNDPSVIPCWRGMNCDNVECKNAHPNGRSINVPDFVNIVEMPTSEL